MKRGRHTGDDVRGDFEPEDRCRIHGLVHASEYNGLEGTVIKWSENMGRWHVLIDLDDGSTTLKNMRCVNMVKIPPAGGVATGPPAGGVATGSGSSGATGSSTAERQVVVPLEERSAPKQNQIVLMGRLFTKLKRGYSCLLCLVQFGRLKRNKIYTMDIF